MKQYILLLIRLGMFSQFPGVQFEKSICFRMNKINCTAKFLFTYIQYIIHWNRHYFVHRPQFSFAPSVFNGESTSVASVSVVASVVGPLPVSVDLCLGVFVFIDCVTSLDVRPDSSFSVFFDSVFDVALEQKFGLSEMAIEIPTVSALQNDYNG